MLDLCPFVCLCTIVCVPSHSHTLNLIHTLSLSCSPLFYVTLPFIRFSLNLALAFFISTISCAYRCGGFACVSNLISVFISLLLITIFISIFVNYHCYHFSCFVSICVCICANIITVILVIQMNCEFISEAAAAAAVAIETATTAAAMRANKREKKRMLKAFCVDMDCLPACLVWKHPTAHTSKQRKNESYVWAPLESPC